MISSEKFHTKIKLIYIKTDNGTTGTGIESIVENKRRVKYAAQPRSGQAEHPFNYTKF